MSRSASARYRSPAFAGRELDSRGCEIALRHDDVEVRERRASRLLQRHAVEQVVRRDAVRTEAEPGRSVRLQVRVDQRHALTRLGQAGADVHGGRRLPDAALLVGDRVDQAGTSSG